MVRVREYGYVRLKEAPPERLRWAFRKVGPVYQVRGVGKYGYLTVEPRWGWESVYVMLDRPPASEWGTGGLDGITEVVRSRFLKVVEEYRRRTVGYRERFNPDGRGKLLPHMYDPLKPLALPAVGDELGTPREVLWLNYLLHRMGYEVEEYEEPPEGAFRAKFLDEPEEEVWKLAYLIHSGLFGYGGDRGFLLNTPYLFEEYVGRKFRGKRAPALPWGIRPDFVLRDGTPLDAKYKVKVAKGDIYQAFTYAKLMGRERAILVYPKVEEGNITLGDVRIEIRCAFCDDVFE